MEILPYSTYYQFENRMEDIKESASIIKENVKKRYYHVGIYG